MRVRILGAGIIGLACADELVRRGHRVEVLDPQPGRGASYAAAGMLTPGSEVWHGEESLWRLGLRSRDLWPAYAARLDVSLNAHGTLLVARDHGDLLEVDRQAGLLEAAGVEVRRLTGRELVEHEPTLTDRLAGGVFLADDPSVDPRAVVAALLERHRVRLREQRGDLDEGGCDVTVVATGSRLPAPLAHLVRGVRGEVLRVLADERPRGTVRGWVRGEPVYVVPRAGGELVIGATSEEHDEDPIVTVGGVARLLEAARELVPALDRATFVEAVARDRPGTRDNLPLVGPSGLPGVVLAAGHFRHGVLLAPLTAQLVADHLETGAVDPALDPRRFGSVDA
jgi:glycine oxidase